VREQYARFDAERIFEVPGVRVADPKAASAASAQGRAQPWSARSSAPRAAGDPIGTCMVSSEGAARLLHFGRFTASGSGGDPRMNSSTALHAVERRTGGLSREQQVLDRIDRARRRRPG